MNLLSVEQVSKRLKVSKGYVYDLIKEGHLAALKFKSIKVPEEVLNNFINDSIGKDFSDIKNVKMLKIGGKT